MALCLPDKPKSGTSGAERKVFKALGGLPDPWVVVHSVAWQGDREGRPGDGEADFVLLHPRHGLIVIEVKGGDIHIEGGQWKSRNEEGDHSIRNPYEQATASKHALVSYLRGTLSNLGFIPTGHGVWFPDVSGFGHLGPAASPEITSDRLGLRDGSAVVKGLVEHWEMRARMSAGDVDAIAALLAPTTSVRTLLRDEVDEARARLIHLTDQQMQVLDRLRRNRRAIIYGGAGTGKTVLAIERARRLAVEGFRVLLTCFNRPLGDYMRSEFASIDEIVVSHFHSLCRWQIGAAAMTVPDDPDSEWWDVEMPSLLPEAAEETGLEFDALVVDEGQDFAPLWFEVLQMLLTEPDSAPMYVFADSHQLIYRDEWQPPFDGLEFELDVNCRNTLPIAELVGGVFGDEVATLGVQGPEPEFHPVADRDDVVGIVRGVLQRLIHDDGLKSSQVVILADEKRRVIGLSGKQIAGQTLGTRGQGDVLVETIHRFKGLEADVVVLILEGEGDEFDPALAYIGMSRARAHLVVVGSAATGERLGF